MLRNIYKIVVSAILLFTGYAANGQFTIPRLRPANVHTREIRDSSRLQMPVNYVNNFENAAWLRVQKRTQRKERNMIEFSPTLSLSQTQFENWAPGGDNTFSARSTVFFRHQYNKNKYSLDYKFEARYGVNYIEGKSFKNEDEFKFYAITGWNFKGHWSYAASVNLRSQFATSYKSRTDNTRVSTFMAPGFLDLAVGFTYNKQPFNIVLSPMGGNATFILDDELSAAGSNGVDPGKRSKWQVGPSARVDFDKAFLRDIFRVRSYFYTFTNLKKVPTVRWENTIDIKATKFLTTTLYALANYDKEAETPKHTALQLKYSFAVGLTYTLKNK